MRGLYILMDCLDNIIGIHRNCNEVEPTSGLWIQNLEGMNMSVVNAAVDNETISGVTLIEEKITHAQNAIVAQIRTQLANKVKVGSIIESDTIGFYKDNLRVVAAESGKLKGIKIRIDNYPHLEFFLSKIFLKLSQSLATEIYIYDLLSDTLLDTIEITTEAKKAKAVLVNKAYQTNKQRLHLFICIDAGVSDTYQTNLSNAGCASCYDSGYGNKYISFSGSSIDSGDQVIDSNLSSNSGTSGLSLEYSLTCSVEPFICSMGNIIAWPLLHKVGAEIMKELQASRRLNSIVNIDSDLNQILQERWENEYMASMGAILNNIQVPNDICFNCNSRLKKAVAIP